MVISPWDGNTTGSFTLTYANDIGGKLTSGKAKKGTLKYEGQNADYTFTAVKGKRVTISITRPRTAPGGTRLQLNVYDSSGAQDTSTDVFSTSPTSVSFTPTGTEAGRTTIVISPVTPTPRAASPSPTRSANATLTIMSEARARLEAGARSRRSIRASSKPTARAADCHGRAVADQVFGALDPQQLLVAQRRHPGGCGELAGQRPLADPGAAASSASGSALGEPRVDQVLDPVDGVAEVRPVPEHRAGLRLVAVAAGVDDHLAGDPGRGAGTVRGWRPGAAPGRCRWRCRPR